MYDGFMLTWLLDIVDDFEKGVLIGLTQGLLKKEDMYSDVDYVVVEYFLEDVGDWVCFLE